MARRQLTALPSESEGESEPEASPPQEQPDAEDAGLLQQVGVEAPASPSDEHGDDGSSGTPQAFAPPKRGSSAFILATLVFCCALIVLQWATAVPLGRVPACIARRETVATAPADPREVSLIELCVGLRVLLVSDPAASIAGAAVDVHSGSLSDPPSFPGLAHMLEHSVFLGNARADETELGRYLSSVGGYTNAYTDLDETNYYFTSSAAGLGGGLARLGQFFVSPSLNASLLQREVHAVDSEHHKNLENDGWRQFQLLKHLSSPRSPFNAFSTGSLATLDKPGLRAALAAFHAKHYRAENMAAAVIGPQPLDELERLVSAALNGVWRGEGGVLAELPPPPPRSEGAALGQEEEATAPPPPSDPLPCWQTSAASPFLAGSLDAPPSSGSSSGGAVCDPRGYYVSLLASLPRDELRAAGKDIDRRAAAVAAMSVESAWGPPPPLMGAAAPSGGDMLAVGSRVLLRPVADTHEVSVYWALPAANTSDHSRVGAAELLAAALGEEGEGSLLAGLKAAGLALGLSAGVEIDIDGFSMLGVSVTLDPQVLVSSAGSARGAADRLRAASQAVQTGIAAYVSLLEAALTAAVVEGWAGLVGPASASSRVFVSGSVLTAASPPETVVAELTSLAESGALLYTASAADAAVVAKKAAAVGAGAGHTPPPGSPSFILSLVAHPPYHPSSPEAAAAAAAGEALLSMPGNATTNALYRAWADAGHMQSAAFAYPHATSDPSKRVAALARALHRYGAADVWGDPARRVWQPAAALALARRLRVEGGISFLVSSALPADDGAGLFPSREPIYGTAFRQEQLGGWTSMLVKDNGGAWAANAEALGLSPTPPVLSLPPPNAFLPRTFALVSHADYAEALGLPAVARAAPGVDAPPPAPVMAVAIDDLLEQLLPKSSSGAATGAAAPRLPSQQRALLTALPVELWWQPDATFARPWGRVTLHLETPASAISPQASVLTSLLLALLRDGAKSLTYPAAKAGLGLSVTTTALDGGLELEVEGYADSLERGLRAYLPQLTGFAEASTRAAWGARLGAQLAALAQGLRNARKEQPYVRALAALDGFLGAKRHETDALMKALLQLVGVPLPSGAGGATLYGAEAAAAAGAGAEASDTSPPTAALTNPALYAEGGDAFSLSPDATAHLLDALAAHGRSLFSGAERLAVTVAGNVDLSQARALFATAAAAVLPLASPLAQAAGAALTDPAAAAARGPPGGSHLLSLHMPPPTPAGTAKTLRFSVDNPSDVNSAAVVAYQAGPRDACTAGSLSACYARDAAFDVLATLIKDPAYETLRTQQQLGYVVFAVPRRVEVGVPRGTLPPVDVPAVLFSGVGESGSYSTASATLSSVSLTPLGDVWQSLVILAQGVAAPAPEMAARITAFVASFEGWLGDLTAEAWEAAKAGTGSQPSRTPPANMGEAADRQGAEVRRRSYRGAVRPAAEAEALSALTKADVVSLFKELTGGSSGKGQQGALVVQAFGHPAPSSEAVL